MIPQPSALAYPSARVPYLRARKPPPYGPRPSGLDARLGRRLREGRQRVRVTQKELGAALGVGAAMVRRYENGTRPRSPARFAAAITFLGLPLSWFFQGDAGR
jgi:Helix-turn-helix domain